MGIKKQSVLCMAAWIVAGFGILLLLLFVTWKVMDARRFQVFGTIVSRVERPDSVIALTFDDGPNPQYTPFLLDVLRRFNVRATFFVIGQEMAKYPESTRQLVNAGYELGNHSYSHRRMVFKSPHFVRTELEKTDSLIRSAGYTGPINFRPPYCKKFITLPFYLARHRRTSITWDVEPESFPEINKHTDRIIEHVLSLTRPGSIILLHPWYGNQATRDALVPIIRGLQARGYRFVTVSQLLATK